MNAAIRCINVGKRYRLGQSERYGSLRESIANWWGGVSAAPVAEIDALADCNFSIEPGTALGIIGRNGSGKSTLLKILARVTAPSSGRIEIQGRVGSLLEVGTGFHPELTGRENIFLSGAVIGMASSDVKRCFDAIVAFAEVEKFLDTPVKRYSSGMHARLGFSVAAHLDTEILLVDEALAVGDVSFQNRCIQRMHGATRNGRTVLYVSHNLGSVAALCQQCLLLNHGRVTYLGSPEEAINRYLSESESNTATSADLTSALGRPPDAQAAITSLALHDQDGQPSTVFKTGGSLNLSIGYRLAHPLSEAYAQVNLVDAAGLRVVTLSSTHGSGSLSLGSTGAIRCHINDLRLAGGNYSVEVELGTLQPNRRWIDFVANALNIRVETGTFLGGAELARGQGPLAQPSHWEAR